MTVATLRFLLLLYTAMLLGAREGACGRGGGWTSGCLTQWCLPHCRRWELPTFTCRYTRPISPSYRSSCTSGATTWLHVTSNRFKIESGVTKGIQVLKFIEIALDGDLARAQEPGGTVVF